MRIDEFSIQIEELVLADLRERIGRTRWPEPVPGSAWQQGTELGYLQRPVATGRTVSTGRRRSDDSTRSTTSAPTSTASGSTSCTTGRRSVTASR